MKREDGIEGGKSDLEFLLFFVSFLFELSFYFHHGCRRKLKWVMEGRDFRFR
jgi:hypothetical protein